MQPTRPVPLVFAALGAALALLALLLLLVMHHPAAADAPDDTGSPQSITAPGPAALARPALDPTAHPILSNLQVRRAIAHCTNKDALIASVYPALTPAQRAALVMDSPILPTSWAYSPPATTYPYNPATGRALLDAAGWTLAPGATYRTKDGKELYLTLQATTGTFRETFLAVFETQMRACGVHVVRNHAGATWVYGAGGLWGRNFELGEYGWLGEEAPDLVNLYGCDHIPSPADGWAGNNIMGWCNPAADAAAAQANNTALTQAQRKAFYATFTNLFAAELPSLVLFRRDGSDIWEHIDFNLETYAQDRPVGSAGTGATPLLYRHHDDLPTRVAVPAGAVAAAVELRFTPLVKNANSAPGGQIAVSSFHLDAVQRGVPAAGYTLASPAVVTVSYPDPALTGDFVEDTLALHVWDTGAQAWQPAVETCPPGQQYAAVDTIQRTVTTNVCHFSEFALLAEHLPDLVMGINYDHDWVQGEYEPGHTVWLTVTNSSGQIKATAQMTTAELPGWGGATGFATWIDDPWQPEQPDLQPGDWVHGAVDNGRTAAAQIGLIVGHVDVDTDSITGTVDVAWLMPGPIDVECQIWAAPGGAPAKQDTIIPDGADAYTCAWDPDSEWDVQPGQDVAVFYREPAGHQIAAVFADDFFYVDGTAGQDSDTCGARATPCHTVGHTLAGRARWGATLHIAAGVYPENLTIDNLAVTLRGGYTPTPAGWTPRTGETVIDGGGVARALLVHGGSDVLLEDLTLTGGRAPEHACWGAGLSVTNGHATLRRVVVRDNVARCTSGQSGGGAGGGLDANNDEGPASLRVEDSLILRNQAGDHGSALSTWQTTVDLVNVVAAGNNRHVMAIYATTLNAVNITVAGNDQNGAALLDFNQPSTITLLNSIVWNSGGISCGTGGGVCNFTYSDVQGGWPGAGNLNVNPQFVDAANGNYRLRWGSPAIDAGTNSGAPPFDLEGVARPQDGNFDGVRVTDMGAYERAPRTLYLPAISRRVASAQ